MTCKEMPYAYLMAALWLLSSCYSFTGANLPPQVKTIQVNTFPNYASIVNPNLSQAFTAELRDFFQTRTTLSPTNEDGDITIEGEITGYQINPASVVSEEQADQNRLTVTIKVRYFLKYDKAQNFEREYTESENFERDQDLLNLQGKMLKDINDRLAQKIFSNTVANW
ncbi:MAG: LptE family protein [Flavobacteriales bacterium]